jgi:hypothetical protein
MHRTQHRVLLTMTAGIAALAFGAAPALAGSDGCSGDDCEVENAPPAIVPVAPVPVAQQPLGDARPAPEHAAPSTRRSHRVRAVTVASVPRGGVAAGAGGTAPAGPDGLLALLAGGALVLVATGGGLVATARRAAS